MASPELEEIIRPNENSFHINEKEQARREMHNRYDISFDNNYTGLVRL